MAKCDGKDFLLFRRRGICNRVRGLRGGVGRGVALAVPTARHRERPPPVRRTVTVARAHSGDSLRRRAAAGRADEPSNGTLRSRRSAAHSAAAGRHGRRHTAAQARPGYHCKPLRGGSGRGRGRRRSCGGGALPGGRGGPEAGPDADPDAGPDAQAGPGPLESDPPSRARLGGGLGRVWDPAGLLTRNFRVMRGLCNHPSPARGRAACRPRVDPPVPPADSAMARPQAAARRAGRGEWN